MRLTYKCMNNSTHSFKGENRNMDGVSCPICGGPVLPGPFDEQKDNALPEYRELKKQSNKKFIQSECLRCKHVQRNECNNKVIDVFVCDECNGASVDIWTKNIKYPAKPKTAITIDLNFDDKSKIKLRAIAKHVGALADELDAIDNADIEKQKEFTVSIGTSNNKNAEDIANGLQRLSTRLQGIE